jgi:hypothetical protein
VQHPRDTSSVPAPIQPEEPSSPGEPLKLSPSPAAPAAGRRRKAEGKEPDPRHRPLQELLEATYRELKHVAYGFQGRDAKAVAELLRLSAGAIDDVEARWRRGLALGSKWPGCGSIAALAARWNDLAPASGEQAPDYTDPTGYQPVSLRR